eukprot:TRINITY_DN1850_c0_g1_i2.p1 TRINITY_DN1850_c0_g1~~TRINITY_DN1850_c0_g1_i2.p1  ORF type:complete len:239 (-),score=84.63 TRINITY_DN1850_c0_g1_i2:103-819(-)
MAMDAGDDYTAFVSTVAELEALQRAEESQLRAASAQAAELRATLCEAAAREDRLRGAADGVDMEQVELRRGELRAALLRRGRLRTALREQRRWLSDVHGATAAERAAEAAHRKLRETYMLAHALALPAAHKAALLARRDELGRCKQLKQLRTGTEEFRAWLDQAVAQHEALARELEGRTKELTRVRQQAEEATEATRRYTETVGMLREDCAALVVENIELERQALALEHSMHAPVADH